MFCVIYEFVLHDQKHIEEFVKIWREMTFIIKANQGGLGSRLHTAYDGKLIAYAQWPDRKTWENRINSTHEGKVLSKKMGDLCSKISILHELNAIDDLLVHL